MARHIRVGDKSIVIVLTKAEANMLLHGFASGYFQRTKQFERVQQKVLNATEEVA